MPAPELHAQEGKKVSACAGENEVQQQLKGAALAIWTTTPWSMPANAAVAVHPRLKYALVEVQVGCLQYLSFSPSMPFQDLVSGVSVVDLWEQVCYHDLIVSRRLAIEQLFKSKLVQGHFWSQSVFVNGLAYASMRWVVVKLVRCSLMLSDLTAYILKFQLKWQIFSCVLWRMPSNVPLQLMATE